MNENENNEAWNRFRPFQGLLLIAVISSALAFDLAGARPRCQKALAQVETAETRLDTDAVPEPAPPEPAPGSDPVRPAIETQTVQDPNDQLASPPSPPAAGSEALDVMLVLDNSGSMKENDPQGLMSKVVTGFAGGLPEGARLGIVLFDDRARLLLGLTRVTSQGFADRLFGALSELSYRGKRTDIPGGMERAIYELREAQRPGVRSAIVLLTDGIIDIGGEAFNQEQSLWLRQGLAGEAKRYGIRIFGIAFTEAADFRLIQSISQTTDGAYFRVPLVGSIPEVFQQILRQISPPEPAEIERSPRPPATAPAPGRAATSVPLAAFEAGPRYDLWLMAGGWLVVFAALLLFFRRARSSALPRAQLVEADGGPLAKPYIIRERVTRIGRDEEANDIVIAHETVSTQHALIEYRNNIFYIRDLKSANGTFLNGHRFSSETEARELPLKHMDRIAFDQYEYRFFVGEKARKRRFEPVAKQPAKPTVLRSSQPPEAAAFKPTDSSWPPPEPPVFHAIDPSRPSKAEPSVFPAADPFPPSKAEPFVPFPTDSSWPPPAERSVLHETDSSWPPPDERPVSHQTNSSWPPPADSGDAETIAVSAVRGESNPQGAFADPNERNAGAVTRRSTPPALTLVGMPPFYPSSDPTVSSKNDSSPTFADGSSQPPRSGSISEPPADPVRLPSIIIADDIDDTAKRRS
jgi:hypothetical protein